jgi:hypothetical protein
MDSVQLCADRVLFLVFVVERTAHRTYAAWIGFQRLFGLVASALNTLQRSLNQMTLRVVLLISSGHYEVAGDLPRRSSITWWLGTTRGGAFSDSGFTAVYAFLDPGIAEVKSDKGWP